MIDVVLINPGAARTIYQNLSDDLSAIEPNPWCRMIAGWLLDRGFDVAILDQDAFRWTPEEVAEQVKKLNPRLVSIVVSGQQPSASTQQMTGASLLAKAIQGVSKIMIGNHPSALPVRTLMEEDVDYVCDGEGPITIAGLLDGDLLSEIPGLVWKDWSLDRESVDDATNGPSIVRNKTAQLIPILERMTRDELIAFEQSVADEFNAGKIRYPIHLDNGNEDALIDIFKNVKPQDWVFVSWRGHYKALLKGVPPEELRAAIHRGESMALRFDQYRVYGGAIVGGMVPIALGTAMAINRSGADEHVWLFIGDMASESGIVYETLKYSHNFQLPISFVIEDNGVSVCTNTREAWGLDTPNYEVDVRRFKYQSKFPHAGSGKRIQF